MAEITKTLNSESARNPSGYAVLPSATEPKNGQDFRVDAQNPAKPGDAGSRWVIGTHTVTYHCSRCSTSTMWDIGPLTRFPIKPICCVGTHADFPHV